MKGTTKNILQMMAMASIFGLVSCTTPVDPGTTDTNTNTTNTNTSNTNTNTSNTNNNPVVSEIYVVQLIATNSSPKAESIKNEFAGEGYPAAVSAIESGGRTLYRVQIGSYGTESDAKRVLNQMKRRYHRNQHVNNAVVKTKNGI
jgi:cell division protein FtsN